MPQLNQVDFLRNRITTLFVKDVMLVRITTSGTDGNQAAVDMLRGEHGDRIVAMLTEALLRHMGHDADVKNFKGTALSATNPNSNNMRAVRNRGKLAAAAEGV